MSAFETIRMAEASGVRLGVDGVDLILDADLEPPVGMINAIRHHKADIIELLSPLGDRWAAKDWQVFFDERAAICEFDGGLSRADAERRGYECLISEWLLRNPPAAINPDSCALCGKPDDNRGMTVPFCAAENEHIWLHHTCYSQFLNMLLNEPTAALLANSGDKHA